jgi:RNase H-like domain found in reverse transcriptase
MHVHDILIFTKTLAEQRRILQLVLKHLRLHRLYLHPEKCEFKWTRIEYLGLIVSLGKVEMDPIKVAGIMDWPVPKNHKEIQAFLGFANFYQGFIEGFSHHAWSLFKLTKKDSKWSWGERKQQAFNGLKQFTSTPILFTNDDLPYRMEVDSLDVARGAVLSQKSPEDDKWHQITFYSKSLTPVERIYDIHNKEMLAIVWALEEWRHFLKGSKHQIGNMDRP